MSVPKVVSTRQLPSPRLAQAARAGKVHLVQWAPLGPGTPHVDPSTPAPREWILANVPGAAALQVMMTDTVDMEVLAAAGPSLRVLATMSAGYDHLDLDAVRRVNALRVCSDQIRVGYTPDVLSAAVADLTLLLALNVMRRTAPAAKAVEAGEWSSKLWYPLAWCGPALAGKTVGFLGFGAIAQTIALKLPAFEVGKIVYTTSRPRAFDPADAYFRHMCAPLPSPGAIPPTGRRGAGRGPRRPTPFPHEEIGVENVADVLALAAEADVLFVMANLTPQTAHVVNERVLDAMKPTAYLINSSRGGLVHTGDLVEALRQNSIAGAGLDVVEGEPRIAKDHPLLADPDVKDKVLLFPHIGSATTETRMEMCDVSNRNVLAGLGLGERNMPHELAL